MLIASIVRSCRRFSVLVPCLLMVVLGAAPSFGAADDIQTIAGGATAGFGGDGGPATAAQLSGAIGVAVDGAGNVFIADQFNNRIRKVDLSGIITTVAGDGTLGSGGDGGPATAAQLSEPLGVAVDGSSNLLIGDTGGNRVRRVDATTGVITTIAGTGTGGDSGDGGAATAAKLNRPRGIVVVPSGDIIVADTNNNRVRRIDGVTGIITTIAGLGGPGGYSGDGGPGTSAALSLPTFVAADTAGNVFIADTFNGRIRRIDAGTGTITTVAGSSGFDPSPDQIPATTASGLVPLGIGVDGAGNVVFADSSHFVRLVHAASGLLTTIAGIGTCGYAGDGGPAISAALCGPGSLAIDATGQVLFADQHSTIRRIVAVATCGNGIVDGGDACDDAVANGTNVSCCGAACATVGDADGDGSCDAIDVCTNVGGSQNFAVKPPAKLVAGNINTNITPGNDKLSLSGEFTSSGAPAFSTIAPQTDGARVVIANGAGTIRIDVRLPAATYAGKGTRGWTLGGGGKKWSYKDATGAPIQGVTKVQIGDKSKTAPGRVQVKVSAGKATYPIVAGDEPLRGVVVLGGPSAAAQGRCGETSFTIGDCVFNGSQATLVCK